MYVHWCKVIGMFSCYVADWGFKRRVYGEGDSAEMLLTGVISVGVADRGDQRRCCRQSESALVCLKVRRIGSVCLTSVFLFSSFFNLFLPHP